MCERLTGDETDCPALDCKARLSQSSVFSRESLSSCLSDQLHVYNPASNSVSEPEVKAEPCPIGSPYGSSKIRAALEALQSLPRMQECNSGARPVPDSCNGTNSGNSSDIRDNPAETSSLQDSSKGSKEPKNAVGEKAIVFSQWTRMLDLLEVCLKSSSIQYRRLDGTMSVNARDKAVKDFNTLPEVWRVSNLFWNVADLQLFLMVFHLSFDEKHEEDWIAVCKICFLMGTGKLVHFYCCKEKRERVKSSFAPQNKVENRICNKEKRSRHSFFAI